MNKLQKFIEQLEADDDRNEQNERLLQMLLNKEREFGPNPTEEETDLAVKQAIAEHLMYALRNKRTGDSVDEDDWAEDMENNMRIVREAFGDMDLHYREYVHQKGVRAFELGVRNDGKTLRMKVYLESAPKVCRIDAIYPFQVERVFAYPLCERLAVEYYPRRFGALQYDAQDGELSYRYSFPVTHGLHSDDFHLVFMAVVASANASYDLVRQYAVGRLRRATQEEITCKAQRLIIELDQ